MSTDSRTPPAKRRFGDILKPGANSVVLAKNFAVGTADIFVSYDADNNNVTVYAQIVGAAENHSLPETTGGIGALHTQLNRVGMTNNYQSSNVKAPISATDVPSDPSTNTKRVFVREYDSSGTATDPADAAANNKFIALLTPMTVDVKAKQCLWLTYGNPTIPFPHGETAAVYGPFAMVVPSEGGATSVTFAATGEWRHNPADEFKSGPEGRAGDAQKVLVIAEYKADPLSANIKDILLPFNRLVGLWDYGKPALVTTELDVLAGAQTIVVATDGTRPVRLRLGMHDSHEWTNNHGTVQVTISWS